MDSLKDIINDVKFFIMDGMVTLPLSIAATMLVIGMFTSNYAMLFFLVGFLLATPLITTVLNLFIGSRYDMFKIKQVDRCMMTNPFRTMNDETKEGRSVISEWLAMMLFFIGYIGMNGYQLYIKDNNGEVTDVNPDVTGKVSTRHTQAVVAMSALFILAVGIVFFRHIMGCETLISPTSTWVGVLIMLLLVAPMFLAGGATWYYLLSLVGENRLSDLFGIANRLLEPDAWTKGPVACVPV